MMLPPALRFQLVWGLEDGYPYDECRRRFTPFSYRGFGVSFRIFELMEEPGRYTA